MSFLRRVFTGQNTRQPPAAQPDTRPFPRFQPLSSLTWDQCFAMNRNQIISLFVAPLCNDQQVRKLANVLFTMMNQPTGKARSTIVLTGLYDYARLPNGKQPRPEDWPKIPAVSGTSPIGSVHWEVRGANNMHVYCHTVTDVLGALMSEAAHLWSRVKEQRTRTKRNYYARLIALYSHWCLRVVGENRRPTKVGLACVGDVIVLGCCIPEIPEMPQAKEFVRQLRFANLKTRGRKEGSKRQILDVKKVETMLWDYGNCAETWTFALLCTLSESDLPRAFGIAVNVPAGRQDVARYDERWERSRERYAPLCVNCEKLMKQIVRWGKPGDKVVENFSVWKWEGPQ